MIAHPCDGASCVGDFRKSNHRSILANSPRRLSPPDQPELRRAARIGAGAPDGTTLGCFFPPSLGVDQEQLYFITPKPRSYLKIAPAFLRWYDLPFSIRLSPGRDSPSQRPAHAPVSGRWGAPISTTLLPLQPYGSVASNVSGAPPTEWNQSAM